MNFTKQFEDKVKKTIVKYKLFTKKDKILVACSGGKDSTVALYLLKKLGYNVEALIVDLEIGNYSKKNLKNTKEFCKKRSIKLYETSFREEFGYSKCKMERILKSKGHNLNSCSVCGVLRRYMLNKKSRQLKFDKIVTGHNLDDEAQSIMMNFFRNTMHLQSRLGPISGNIQNKKFIPRVKPLYFCLEKDVKKYSKLHKFDVVYEKCPCLLNSYRLKVKEILDKLPNSTKIKKNIINNFLNIFLPKLKKQNSNVPKLLSCFVCGEPSSEKKCTTCRIMKKLNN